MLYRVTRPDLIDGTRNEAMDVLICSEDHWEGGTEGGCGLDGREGHLPNVVTVAETKDALSLVHSDALLNL